MEIIKTTEDLQFTLHYADGATRNVNKGILFEEAVTPVIQRSRKTG